MLQVVFAQAIQASPTFWEQIQPTVVTVVVTLIPVLGTAVAAWVKHTQRLRWETAKQATMHAEEVAATFMGGLSGKAKMAVALDHLQKNTPSAARMTDPQAVKLINQVLRESQPGAVPVEVVPNSARPPPLPKD